MVIFTPKHALLRDLHWVIRPKTYLEIGVQSGLSFGLAGPLTTAIGIDPAPWGMAYTNLAARHHIYPITSDDFFTSIELGAGSLDFAFIDGLHLIEAVWQDFLNVERYAHPGTIVAIDDVLPRDQYEARREANPGDWTGDVWKIGTTLNTHRPDLTTTYVDVAPTGLLLVYGFPSAELSEQRHPRELEPRLLGDMLVPEDVLAREGAVTPGEAVDRIKRHLLDVKERT